MSAENSKLLTWADVAKHNKEDDLWIVIGDGVYDVSSYSLEHPGGPIVLQNKGGRNATLAFEQASHSQNARNAILPKYKIGTIDQESPIEEWQKEAQASGPSLIGTVSIVLIILGLIYYLAA